MASRGVETATTFIMKWEYNVSERGAVNRETITLNAYTCALLQYGGDFVAFFAHVLIYGWKNHICWNEIVCFFASKELHIKKCWAFGSEWGSESFKYSSEHRFFFSPSLISTKNYPLAERWKSLIYLSKKWPIFSLCTELTAIIKIHHFDCWSL